MSALTTRNDALAEEVAELRQLHRVSAPPKLVGESATLVPHADNNNNNDNYTSYSSSTGSREPRQAAAATAAAVATHDHQNADEAKAGLGQPGRTTTTTGSSTGEPGEGVGRGPRTNCAAGVDADGLRSDDSDTTACTTIPPKDAAVPAGVDRDVATRDTPPDGSLVAGTPGAEATVLATVEEAAEGEKGADGGGGGGGAAEHDVQRYRANADAASGTVGGRSGAIGPVVDDGVEAARWQALAEDLQRQLKAAQRQVRAVRCRISVSTPLWRRAIPHHTPPHHATPDQTTHGVRPVRVARKCLSPPGIVAVNIQAAGGRAGAVACMCC